MVLIEVRPLGSHSIRIQPFAGRNAIPDNSTLFEVPDIVTALNVAGVDSREYAQFKQLRSNYPTIKDTGLIVQDFRIAFPLIQPNVPVIPVANIPKSPQLKQIQQKQSEVRLAQREMLLDLRKQQSESSVIGVGNPFTQTFTPSPGVPGNVGLPQAQNAAEALAVMKFQQAVPLSPTESFALNNAVIREQTPAPRSSLMGVSGLGAGALLLLGMALISRK